jgi:hypothetical protein
MAHSYKMNDDLSSRLPDCPEDNTRLEPKVIVLSVSKGNYTLYALYCKKCGSYAIYQEPPSRWGKGEPKMGELFEELTRYYKLSGEYSFQIISLDDVAESSRKATPATVPDSIAEESRARFLATLTCAPVELVREAMKTGDWSEVEKCQQEAERKAGEVKIVT